MTRRQVLAKMKWARQCHLNWARSQRRRRAAGVPQTPRVGSESHHRRWVRIYDATIELLEAGAAKAQSDQ